MSDKQTFFFMFAAKPKEAPRELDAVAGAYVNCWILGDSEQQAEQLARTAIDSNGWDVESLEEHRPVCREDYTEDTQGLEYFEQAQVDGQVCVYHTWPLGGNLDSEEIH